MLANINMKEYLSRDAISASGLKTIYNNGLAPYKWHLENPSSDKECFRFGNYVHLMLLEGYSFEQAVQETYPNLFLKSGEFSKSMALQNKIVFLKDVHTSIKDSALVKAILRDGDAEQSFFWSDNNQEFKCRFDYVVPSSDIVIDVKTTADYPGVDSFRKEIEKFSYDLQAYHYCRGYKECFGRDVKDFYFLVLSKKPPYEVALYVVSPDIIDIGEYKFNQALEKYNKAKSDGNWSDVPLKVQNLETTDWIRKKYEALGVI